MVMSPRVMPRNCLNRVDTGAPFMVLECPDALKTKPPTERPGVFIFGVQTAEC
jgi:hypothetical protein